MSTLVAELTGADPGLVGTLTIAVRRAADDVVVIPTTAAGIIDLGGGSYRYTAELADDDYIVHWDDGAGGTAEEGITVAAGGVVPPPPPVALGTVYATAADLRARLNLDAAALPDADAVRLIEAAERRLDRLAGAWPIRPNGRKLDPTSLPSLFSIAIREATLDLAAAEQRNPGAYALPVGKSIIGPDFRVMDLAGLPPDGQAAVRDAVARLDALDLRALTARPRP